MLSVFERLCSDAQQMEIGELIRIKRKAAGYTQRSLASAMGVAPSAVAQWEKGDTLPTNANMAALKRLLGLDGEILVSPGAPYAGKLVDDPDKLALLAFWDSLSDVKREALTDMLNIGEPAFRKAV